MRISILDGFRGFFILFMMIIHTNGFVLTTIGKLNHHYFGWVEDAQGFVFISGIVVGIVYGRILLRHSAAKMRSAIMRRMKTIYSHQVGLILTFLAMALGLTWMGFEAAGLSDYSSNPVTFTLSSLLLVSASMHMGILPMYLYFMLVTPLALIGFMRGHARLILSISVGIWALGQTGLDAQLATYLEGQFTSIGIELKLGLFFNLLGWQIIYFVGLYLGFLQGAERLDLSFFQTTNATYLAAAAAIAFVGLGVFDRIVYWDLISVAFSENILAYAVGSDFSALHLANFVVDLYLIT